MAKYRQLQTYFWDDSFILDLNTEEKCFYLYLMTNYKSTQCGIYELPKRIIELHTGCSRENVDKLLSRFQKWGKIKYCEDTKEIIILNWLKYNQPNNTNAIKCVNKELKSVKNREFLLDFYNQCQKYDLDMESIFKDMEITAVKTSPKSEAPSKPPASNKVISNKQELINNKQKTISNKQLEKAIKCFENKIHLPKQEEINRLNSWCSTMGCDIVIMAIEKAVQYNAKNMHYIEKIMNNWIKDGINTAKTGFRKNMSGWNLTNERTYDFKELERKLLGW